MPSITLSVSSAGPTCNVMIGPTNQLQAALTAAGVVVPQPVSGTFLVDTGASCTAVDISLITKMGLQPTGVAMVHTPSTAGNPAPMYLYDVMLYIPGHSPGSNDGWFIESLPVTANHFAGTGIDGLIGRDVLDLGIMIYNGTAGQFTLAY